MNVNSLNSASLGNGQRDLRVFGYSIGAAAVIITPLLRNYALLFASINVSASSAAMVVNRALTYCVGLVSATGIPKALTYRFIQSYAGAAVAAVAVASLTNQVWTYCKSSVSVSYTVYLRTWRKIYAPIAVATSGMGTLRLESGSSAPADQVTIVPAENRITGVPL